MRSAYEGGSPLSSLPVFKLIPLAREKTRNVNCATERIRIIRKAFILLPRRLKDNIEHSRFISPVIGIHLFEVNNQ